MKKLYINPSVVFEKWEMQTPCMGNASLPYGGDDGPGIAESKERQEQPEEVEQEEEDSSWGNLW